MRNGLRIIHSDMLTWSPWICGTDTWKSASRIDAPRPVRVATRGDLWHQCVMFGGKGILRHRDFVVLQPRPGGKRKSCHLSVP